MSAQLDLLNTPKWAARRFETEGLISRCTPSPDAGCSPASMSAHALFLPPAAHHADPVTSYRAEPKANIKGQALTLLRQLREHGPCTMKELSRDSGLDYYLCQKRISVLLANGLARVARIRACQITGNDCQEWTAV